MERIHTANRSLAATRRYLDKPESKHAGQLENLIGQDWVALGLSSPNRPTLLCQRDFSLDLPSRTFEARHHPFSTRLYNQETKLLIMLSTLQNQVVLSDDLADCLATATTHPEEIKFVHKFLINRYVWNLRRRVQPVYLNIVNHFGKGYEFRTQNHF